MARRTAAKQRHVPERLLQRSGVSLLLIALLFLAGGLVVGFVRMAWQEHQINREMERQQAENAAQVDRNLRLKGQAEYAESDVAAEQAARERLGMARDGETVLLPTVVLPPTPTAAVPALAAAPDRLVPPSQARAESRSNAARWFKALFPGPDAVP